MIDWLYVIAALLSASAFLVMALGYLFPHVAVKQRAAAVFYLVAAIGGFMQAWEWGKQK